MIEHTLQYGSYKYPTIDFNSMSEIAQYLNDTTDLKSYKLTQNDFLTSESEFYGVKEFDTIIDRLKYGDKDTTSLYLKNLAECKNAEGEENTDIHMDIEGFSYDMGAVVSGEPECCVSGGFPKVKPHLNIYIDTGYSGRVSPKIIANRGVAIYQLISNLLSKGYLLDIWIVHYIDVSGRQYCQRVKLSTEYLTVSQLAFAGKCEFFRVVTWLLTAIQMRRRDYDGSGCSMPKSEVVETLKKDGLFIPSGYTDSRFNSCSREQALEYVTKIYNDYVWGIYANNKGNTRH